MYNPAMETLATILKALEKIFLSPRVAATVFLVCLTVLLAGPHVAGFAPLVRQYAAWFWIFLLLSGFYSVSFPAQWVWKTSAHALAKQRNKQREISRLKSLTLAEKHILQEFVEEGERVVSWSMNRLEIAALAHDGIIAPIQSHGSIAFFKVSDEAWECLLEHKELITTPGKPRPKRTGNEWMI